MKIKSKILVKDNEVISKFSFWMKFLNLSRIEAKILRHSLYSVEGFLQRCMPNSGISDEYAGFEMTSLLPKT